MAEAGGNIRDVLERTLQNANKVHEDLGACIQLQTTYLSDPTERQVAMWHRQFRTIPSHHPDQAMYHSKQIKLERCKSSAFTSRMHGDIDTNL